VAEAIMEKAVELFADRGFNGTGIRDIAEEMGMSRAAVYHYFETKEVLVGEIVAGVTHSVESFLRQVRNDQALGHRDKLVEMVQGMALRISKRPAHMRLLASREGGLPESLRKSSMALERKALEHVEATIAAGVEAGELRPVNERIAALALFGMCNWIAWWYHPGDALTGQEIGSEMARIAVDGLSRSEARRGASGAARAIELLREDLDQLERMLPASQRRR
jgi:AcrR family transcriptional regulator